MYGRWWSGVTEPNLLLEIPDLPFSSCVALDELLNLSVLQFLHIFSRDNINANLKVLL